ncbi:hypothetical protein [Methylobacterium oryzisoli]|uniref:hypothetical protein n=1 Tax=Methylobacterium oryzisoli TaxID=3385502 RepID=UPI0038929A11
MKHSQHPQAEMTLIKPLLHPREFGSAFDPVLSGVADGLGTLFPLVPHPLHQHAQVQEPAPDEMPDT